MDGPQLNIDEDRVRDALRRICDSEPFLRADRLKELLTHIVEETLAGRQENLLGKNLARDLYDLDTAETADFSAIRVEVGRLRRQLHQYYTAQGSGDAVVISIPKGSYVAEFSRRTPKSAGADTDPPVTVARGRLKPAGVVALALLIGVIVLGSVSWWARPRAPSDQAGFVPRIAIGQIENLSQDSTLDQTSRGLTVDIGNRLAKFSHMIVVSRQATQRSLQKAETDTNLAELLQADYLLSGALQVEDRSQRLSVELIRSDTGDIVWAEQFVLSKSDENIFSSQLEIANAVARRLAGKRGQISLAEISESESAATRASYQCVLRYFAYQSQRSEEEHAAIRDCLEQASVATPGYSEIWSSLAQIYLDERRNSFNVRGDEHDPIEKAYDAARKGVELDPTSSSAYSVLAAVEYFRKDFDAFLATSRTAVSLNPNDVDALAYYAHFLSLMGQWEEGQALMDRAKAMSPAHIPAWYASSTIYAVLKDDYERALAEARLGYDPRSYISIVWLVVSHGMLGNRDEAIKYRNALEELRPGYLSELEADLRRRNLPQEVIDRAKTGVERAYEL